MSAPAPRPSQEQIDQCVSTTWGVCVIAAYMKIHGKTPTTDELEDFAGKMSDQALLDLLKACKDYMSLPPSLQSDAGLLAVARARWPKI